MDVAHTYTTYVLSAVVAYATYRALRYLSSPSPLRDIPGPPNPSVIFGNFKELAAVSGTDGFIGLKEKWAREYGHTVGYRILFNVRPRSASVSRNVNPERLQRVRVFTVDPKAISHVLMRSDLYWKPESLRRDLIRMMGEGVLVAEGDKHRAQRRLLNPAFGPGQVRELTAIFLDKANEVRI
jgi:cytochrome P450